MQYSRTIKATSALLLAALPLVFTGCRSDPDDVSQRAIFNNLTPELRSTHERPVDVRRHMAVNTNQNWRMLHDDLGRVFLTDHPSRLTGKPAPSTSGHHR